ncbi:enoyl-CoA hydratase-related protein [Nocardia sp. NPDC051030]|uniref:enoyl-CoA hydratase/isomerase family protein n=1 Tax=Nocardia sp. NPDC051030 TaxID=3155162 RepID=UPI0034231767
MLGFDDDGPLDTIEYSVADGIATLCLNRPAARNAIDLRLAEELLIVARRCAGDRNIRAVLITGNGPALTVGGDIEYFTESSAAYGELFRRMTGPFHEAFRILSRLEVPIVTAAHGSVAGGGLGFVYIADFVLAAEGTKFATGFAAIGLSGDGGGTWFLPRLVGPRRAAQMYLRNRVLDAHEAADWGLITEVVTPGELAVRADALVRELAAGPTKALGQMRALLRASWDNTLSEQFVEESEALAATGNSADAAHAIECFAAKRRPTFEGR